MGRVVLQSGLVMATRLVLLRDDADEPAVNPAAFDGDVIALKVGDYPAREFRREDGRLFVIQKVAAQATNGVKRWLVVVYAPADQRDKQTAFSALVTDMGADVIKSWATSLNADGTLRVPTLDSDATAIGTAVKGVWPAKWRVSMPGDPDSAPTGARTIGDVLA
jgi:hypothetical protein